MVCQRTGNPFALRHISRALCRRMIPQSPRITTVRQRGPEVRASSAFPPLTKGKLRLYSMRFCPYAHRTRLVLAHKGIPYETVNVHLKEKPEWLWEKNPLGMIPVLEIDDKIIYESLITCDYLDDVYPNNRLTPSDPFRKASDAMLIDFFGSKMLPSFYKVFHSEGKDEEAKETMGKAMNKMEDEIKTRGKFFGGEQVAMIDLMIWPWFERICIFTESVPSFAPSDTVYPKLFAWIQAMIQQPAVKEFYFDPDTYLTYIQAYKQGKPNFDFGLEP